jgi:hypothetical protein
MYGRVRKIPISGPSSPLRVAVLTAPSRPAAGTRSLGWGETGSLGNATVYRQVTLAPFGRVILTGGN